MRPGQTRRKPTIRSMTTANGKSNAIEDDEPNTDPDLVWSTPTWSDAAEGTAPGGVSTARVARHRRPRTRRSSRNRTRAATRDSRSSWPRWPRSCSAAASPRSWSRPRSAGRSIDDVRERNRDTGRLNEPVRDGDLEFRVSRVDCGVPELGDSFVYPGGRRPVLPRRDERAQRRRRAGRRSPTSTSARTASTTRSSRPTAAPACWPTPSSRSS